MKSQHELPERLQTALEGATYDPGDREVVRLVHVAALTRDLAPAGPTLETAQRLRAGFTTRMSAPVPPMWLRWLGAWVGSGPAPRPLLERVAAGVMLIGVASGSAGAAAGVSPVEMASGTVRFVDSLVSNLDPRGSDGGGIPSESPTPTAPATPTPPATPSPGATASGTASPTPTDDHDDDDDDHSDDDSRRRSENSGRGNSEDDEPDDNPSPTEDAVR